MERIVGEVVFFTEAKIFGFIQEVIVSQDRRPRQYFFHLSQVKGQLVLKPGDLVSFVVAPSPKKPGMVMAADIHLMKRDAAPASAVRS